MTTSLAVDWTVYETPVDHPERRDSSRQAERRARREARICTRCPLPVCAPRHRDCPIRPVCADVEQSRQGAYGRIRSRTRRGMFARHGGAIQQHLQTHGTATCPEIAAAIGCDEGSIYTAMASLILEHGAPIRPCGMRDNAALYRYITGTNRAIITPKERKQ